MRLRCGILIAILSSFAAQAAEEGRWAFAPEPDHFSTDALLDLRDLNEKVAGAAGFVRVGADGHFVLGDGKPARFWAVNTFAGHDRPWRAKPLGRKSEPDLALHARFLAKRGVNLVRLHAFLNPRPEAAHITDINEQDRDWIWRTVAAMKKEGIYCVISPYWANKMRFNPAWGVSGGAELDGHSLLFFDRTLQQGYRAWLKALYAEKNPYTGIPLAKDPAVAVIQLQNEDSLLFWTVNNLGGDERREFCRQYAVWLIHKHGSLDAALKSWDGNRVKGDDLQNGILEFHNIYEMTQSRTGGLARRLDDQLQFWSETMYNFNKSMAAYLRKDLGCGQLINAGNWKTADARLEDAERWSYTATDVIAVNRYFTGIHVGKNRGWAVMKGDEFTSPSALLDPRNFPLNLKQVRGYPTMVTESSWVFPDAYDTEGPFLIAAFQSLTGVDAFFWFSTGDDEWTPPQSANGFMASQQKWLFGGPDTLGTFPAAALLYRKGYLRRAAPVVTEERTLDEMWRRAGPAITESPGYDPNRDAGDAAPRVKSGIDPLAFLAGPVEAVYGADRSRTRTANLADYIDSGTVRGATGETVFNATKGFCTVDAPQAQGVTAFFRNQRVFHLRDVEIDSNNEYGSVLVVSMDGRPIASSSRLLVQVGTESRPGGWKEGPKPITLSGGRTVDGFEVLDFGRAPWQVVRADLAITVRNRGLKKATILDMNGERRADAPLERVDSGIRLRFPPDAMYVVLQ